jgi:hypothetical protein
MPRYPRRRVEGSCDARAMIISMVPKIRQLAYLDRRGTDMIRKGSTFLYYPFLCASKLVQRPSQKLTGKHEEIRRACSTLPRDVVKANSCSCDRMRYTSIECRRQIQAVTFVQGLAIASLLLAGTYFSSNTNSSWSVIERFVHDCAEPLSRNHHPNTLSYDAVGN